MGDLTPLHQPETAESIRLSLIEDGFVTAPISELTVTAEDWRRIARKVARELGRPLRTMQVGDDVTAMLTDYPRDDVEKQRHDRRLRETVNFMEHPLGWQD